LDFPLTMSILPNLSYSQSAAQRLHELGFEIILHLPMEPQERKNMEENTILTGMGAKEISRIIAKDLASVPYAVGASNHMGSLATENEKTMLAVFKELKKRNLYFLDSFVSDKSVCHNLARQVNLPFARRSVFLDNRSSPDYIKNQVGKLKNMAAARGQAVGIGHDRKNTLKVLKEAMPQIAKEGYTFVFVSELVE